MQITNKHVHVHTPGKETNSWLSSYMPAISYRITFIEKNDTLHIRPPYEILMPVNIAQYSCLHSFQFDIPLYQKHFSCYKNWTKSSESADLFAQGRSLPPPLSL